MRVAESTPAHALRGLVQARETIFAGFNQLGISDFFELKKSTEAVLGSRVSSSYSWKDPKFTVKGGI
jgi:hypothetical protein